MSVRTNIVSQGALRNVQLDTLKTIANTIAASFGPMGSNTLILQDGRQTKYSKDGFTLLKDIKFLGVIEEATRQDVEDVLRNIIKEFGDNSSSAAILSYYIFDALIGSKTINKETPHMVISHFKEAVQLICKEIMSHARPFTADVAYDIAYTSTNGDNMLASALYDIYRLHGNNVYIEISTSTNEDFIVKEVDGLMLESGYMDPAMITNKSKNTATVYNPNVYYFEDPIDTPEMAAFFDTIIGRNIIEPLNNREAPTPTVILSPMISRDYSSTIQRIIEFMGNSDTANRPPLLIVTNIFDKSVLSDIAMLCGCKTIRKYIDMKSQEADVAKGEAPDLVTITAFCGKAEVVESDYTTTKFVHPQKMIEYVDLEDGSKEIKLTSTYNTLIEFLEHEVKREKESPNPSTGTIAVLNKRLHALQGNFVELYVGGISPAERDSRKDLIEDAVLNCRSAAKYGYGYGANYMGLKAAEKLYCDTDQNDPLKPYFKLIYEQYVVILQKLYATVVDTVRAEVLVVQTISEDNGPVNLRTLKFDGRVISSIRSDVAVLDSIGRILTIMYTCNQALVQTPVVNTYEI